MLSLSKYAGRPAMPQLTCSLVLVGWSGECHKDLISRSFEVSKPVKPAICGYNARQIGARGATVRH